MSLTVLCFLGVATRLLAFLPVVEAQTTTATCLPEFAWMNNSRNQSPCLVAAYAQGACNGGQFTVAALAPDHHYTGPFVDEINPCQCSTVIYSLVSACAICQNRTIETWSAWDTNCTQTYLSQFIEQIPSGTSIPAWAYLDVATSDTFSPDAAQADLSAPESSGSASKPTASVTSSTAESTTSGPSISFSTPTPSSDGSGTGSQVVSKKSSNAGAIAGGVVGGLVGLGLIIGLLVFFFIRRPRNRIAPSATYGAGYNQAVHSDTPLNTPAPMSQHSYTNQSPRLYDPSDPSTYPQSPPTPTVQTTNTAPHPYAHHPNPGNYSGVPEL